MIRGLCTFLIVISMAGPSLAVSSKVVVVEGIVTANDQTPIMGATVSLIAQDTYLVGMATNNHGKFFLKASYKEDDTLFLFVSAIGFESRSFRFILNKDTLNFEVQLNDKPLEYGTIEVISKPYSHGPGQNLTSHQLSSTARHSLVTTNPVSAIRQPQAVREGSAHSSKIRVNGSSPTYYMNGIEMGRDPNHYGMFSIVPGSVVERMRFIPQGNDAKFGSPAIIEFETSQSFDRKLALATEISFVEGTGSAKFGGRNYFLLSSLRHSVLDMIADKITRDSDRSPIPPTSFLDIYNSGGIRLFQSTKVVVDHYQVRDYLSYNLSSTANNPGGVKIEQNTGEKYLGLRLETSRGPLRLALGGAYKESHETYLANSLSGISYDMFAVNLRARSNTLLGNLNSELSWNRGGLALGATIKRISDREIDLIQNNWNFLPPDASSDEPYIYQKDLNLLYGYYHNNDSEFDGACYLSGWKIWSGIRFENGIRIEQFNRLAKKLSILYRTNLEVNGGPGIARLSHGTYAENPSSRILESYQVLVHDNLEQLLPVKTSLTALSYSIGLVTLGTFYKEITHLPAITPDFSLLDEDGNTRDGFISMRPLGEIRAMGGDLIIQPDRPLWSRIDLYASYGYTYALKKLKNIQVPYELNAPHKFYFDTAIRVSNLITIGGNIAIRSGYPYSQAPDAAGSTWSQKYTEDYYRAVLEKENSRNFPVNFNSNIYLDLKMGSFLAYVTLCNVSSYRNPIIKTSNGFIYDTGILPSIGLKFSF